MTAQTGYVSDALVAEMVRAALNSERDTIAAEARRYASHYTPSTDPYNTFILFAEYVERRALEAADAARGGEHIGWLYFNEDTGTEWSAQNPLESGECPDATRVRPATCENLLFELKAAWELAADASREAASDAAPPAGTVAVRVAVAFDEDGEPGIRNMAHSLSVEDAWSELDSIGYSRPSCIATIHAPLPAVPEVGATVEGV